MVTGKGNFELGPDVPESQASDSSARLVNESINLRLSGQDRTVASNDGLPAGLDPTSYIENFNKRIAPLVAAARNINDPHVLGSWSDIFATLSNPRNQNNPNAALAEAANLQRIRELG